MIFFAIALGLSIVYSVYSFISTISMRNHYGIAVIWFCITLLLYIALITATSLMLNGAIKSKRGQSNVLCPFGSVVLLVAIIANIFRGSDIMTLMWALIILHPIVLIILDGFIRPRLGIMGIIGSALLLLIAVVMFVLLIIHIPSFINILFILFFVCYGLGSLFYAICREPRLTVTVTKNVTWYQPPQQNYYPQNQPPQYQYNYDQNQYRQYQPPQPPQPENQPPQAASQSGDELEKKLEKLKDLRDRQLITEEEYSEQVRRLLNDF